MMRRPMPGFWSFRAGKGRPLFLTFTTRCSPVFDKTICTAEALPCLMPLVTASCAILYNWRTMLLGNDALWPEQRKRQATEHISLARVAKFFGAGAMACSVG